LDIRPIAIQGVKRGKLKKGIMENYDNFTGCFRAICILRHYLTI
jgi:hypothetical protein